MAIRARTSPQTILEIIRLVRAGERTKVMEIDLGVTAASIRKYSAHVPRPKEPKKAKAIELLANTDSSIADIAKACELAVYDIDAIVRAQFFEERAIETLELQRLAAEQKAAKDARRAAKKAKAACSQ